MSASWSDYTTLQVAQDDASAPPAAVQGSVRAVWSAVHSVLATSLEHAIQYPTVGNDPAGRDSGLAQLKSTPRPEVRIR